MKIGLKILVVALAILPISFFMSACNGEELKTFSNIAFNAVNVDYDGEEHTILLDGDLPEGTIVEYRNNVGVNAGEYNASVTLSLEGYKTITLKAKLKINKIDYDMSNAHWSYQSAFTYNGSNREVIVVGLPQGVTVASYQNNRQSAIGTYTATATFNYDTVNYNPVVLESCVWKIMPNLANFASSVINSLMNVPDPWEFLPESFSIDNKAYTGNTEIDYSSFVSVSSLPQVVIGKQMNVVYSTLLDFDKALSYVRDVYGYLNVIVNFYQTFINDNPENYANYEKQTNNFTFKIVIDNDDYKMYISYMSVAIELSYQSSTQKCYGRMQLSDSNVIKYEMADDNLTVATEVLGVVLAILHFERNNNVVVGYLYEYYGTEAHNIKTSALIKVDSIYTSIISNKRETDDLLIEGYMEVYKNSTGKLVGAEVRETVKSIQYETSWFNLWDVQGVNTIKVEDEANGTNADTIYINGNANAIKTKLVGGLSGKSLSRRFDIEMKDMFIYKYNATQEKYEKIKIQIPMLFIQNDYINSFSDDFWSKNNDTGAINPTTLSLQTQDKNYLLSKYATLIDAYVQLKEGMTYATIKSYIGTKNEYFN